MPCVTIYRFMLYDITTDSMRPSRRWATREAIERLRGHILEETGTEIDSSMLSSEIEGMSAINFNPSPRRDFQTVMTT